MSQLNFPDISSSVLVSIESYAGIPQLEKTITFSSEEEGKKVKREVELIKGLRTTYVVPLFSSIVTTTSVTIRYEKYHTTLMNFLKTYLKKNERLSELGFCLIFTTILKGLFATHQLGLAHRNLTTEAIYLKNTGEIAIGELDRIKEMSHHDQNSISTVDSFFFTNIPYESPELRSGIYDQRIDVWSLGCILYDMVTRFPINSQVLSDFRRTKTINFGCAFPYNKKILKLMEMMLEYDYTKRITSTQLMNDPFILQCLLICRDKTIMSNGVIHNEMKVQGKAKIESIIINDLVKDSEEEITSKLGSGGCGDVYVCKKAGIEIVKKTVAKEPLIQNGINYKNEIGFCHMLFHDNIITTLIHLTDEDDNYYNIYMEKCDRGDLTTVIHELREQGKQLSIYGVYKILCSILNGLYHIHKHNLIHRDLKPENILLSSNGSIVICDLGIITEVPKNPGDAVAALTIEYAPYELINCPNYDHKVDIFSLGVLMYYICTGTKKSAYDFISTDENLDYWKLPPPYNNYEQFQDILNSMLRRFPEDRISIDGLFEDETIIKFNYLLRPIPFIISGKLNDSMIFDNPTPSPSKTPKIDFNLFDLYVSNCRIPSTNKFIPQIENYEELNDIIFYIFPDLHVFKVQIKKYKIDLKTYNFRSITNIVDMILEILGFKYKKPNFNSRQYTYVEIQGYVWSWGKLPNILHGLTNLFSILRLIYKRNPSHPPEIRSRIIHLFSSLYRISMVHPGDFPYNTDITNKWIDCCTDNKTVDMDVFDKILKQPSQNVTSSRSH